LYESDIRLIIFVAALAVGSILNPLQPVLISQVTRSDINRRGAEDSDGPLKEVERDIAANRLQEGESRLSTYL